MRLPIFPLHTVLAPGIVLPLHVFEERYRVMIRRCLDASAPFGVVLIREGSEVAPAAGQERDLAIAGVGTFAEIREASRHADGRWDLVVVGTGRFSVVDVDAEEEPYLVAEVDPREDDPGDPAAAAELVGRVGRRFVEYLRLLEARDGELGPSIEVQVEVEVPDDDDDDADDEDDDADDEPVGVMAAPGAAATLEMLRVPDDPSTLSFLLTGIVQVEPDRKQALLEAPTAEERLRDLDDLLDREITLLERRLALYVPDRRALADLAN